ncbi:Crp/Fnr family transcriptional regulator [Marinifilum caeruleilacunae]|uniref:Crp/Fnr family transcriptional regulator n=1 Tax=Marinifilum caeruleilacunae TaxID=2499076 RepID=A0ABX1WVM0_9BACT|nr:Crp/Fnr family transcriptional regulator [Marinifilum caeruleilacunae]NOU59944.1 Crp/Fnr family transcriptional regulator [Marinifilum caeruleilacunae]
MNYLELVQKNADGILHGAWEEVTLEADRFVLEQGDPSLYCHILLEGKVKVFHTTTTGQSFLFGIFDQPQLFGHLEIPTGDAFFNSVLCLSKCKLLKITRETYLNWLKKDSEFAMKVNLDLCSKLMNTSYRMVEDNYFPLEYHLIKFIIDSSDNFNLQSIEINKTDLANYFGTNVRSINRLLKQLSNNELISLNKNKLDIIKQHELNTLIKKYF